MTAGCAFRSKHDRTDRWLFGYEIRKIRVASHFSKAAVTSFLVSREFLFTLLCSDN